MKAKVKDRDWKKWAGDNSALLAFAALFVLAVILQGRMFLSFNNIINYVYNTFYLY